MGCLWDRDTLAMEAKPFPGLAEILTGRFERQPPRFYQMRLDRVTRELAAHPDDLALLDDAAVACDRLGRSDDAIVWMERKAAALAKLNPNDPTVRDHHYRYLANLGTFRAHRWLRNGARRSELADLQESEKALAAAIKINPDAHFGREIYQLAAVRWLLTLPEPIGEQPILLDALLTPDTFELVPALDPERAIRGISGLIVLGEAWESVDVTAALEAALAAHDDASLAKLADLRLSELKSAGKKSLHPRFNPGVRLDGKSMYRGYAGHNACKGVGLSELEDSSDVEEYFLDARGAATRAQEARWAYMEARFNEGKHPDTDPEFWKGWHEPPVPSLPNGWSWPIIAWSGASIVAIGVLGVLRVRRRRSRNAQVAV
jgi:tetratricopeptide (TPR) repeat protein